jgi:signal transduction histidine kinase
MAKQMRWPGKIFRSVFAKLLVVIILTGLCVNIVVGGFFWIHRSDPARPLHKNISQYLNYIIDDLGDPPDLQRARRIGKQAALQIYYEGSTLSWTTAEGFSEFKKAHWRNWGKNPAIRIGRYRGHHFVEIDQRSGRFIFGFDKNFEMDPERGCLVVILILLLTLIFAGAFFAIRWILKPVRWLDEGVRQVGGGNLKHRVPVKRSDEFRDLAEAFNDMTDRIQDMMHIKERLMLDVSHELRSPLTRVKVALELLPSSQAKDSIAGDVLEMEKMINEILETARAHHLHAELKLKPSNLVDLLAQIVADYEKQPPGVRLQEVPASLEVNVDPERIKTVLQNIISNSIKFSDADSDPVRILIKTLPDDTVVQIADNGIGIAEDELPFIFEPFYRVDKSRSKDTGGYGLGLSLCKTIIEAHGGKIEVQSTPDVGTTVSLFFPANAA